MSKIIRILLADDHQIFLDGLRAILKAEQEIRVVAEARSGTEVIEMLDKHLIDIVVLDIEMPPGINGIETAAMIRQRFPHVRVLMLTMHDKEELIEKLLKIPVDGYILKNKGAEQLVEAIHRLDSGRTFFSSEIMETLVKARKKPALRDEIKLTPREEEVLRLIANEFTTPEIADKLCIAQSTVETHRRNLIGKLQVKNTLGLVRWAVEKGYG